MSKMQESFNDFLTKTDADRKIINALDSSREGYSVSRAVSVVIDTLYSVYTQGVKDAKSASIV